MPCSSCSATARGTSTFAATCTTRFNAELQRRLAGTVWTAGCSNWYVTESGKVTNNWPGVAFEYRRRTRRFRIADYRVAQPLIESSAGARSV